MGRVRIQVDGLDRLVQKLGRLAIKAKPDRVQLTVGYAAPYAIYVHEDLYAHHKVGQAKFLEQPVRQYRNDMKDAAKRLMQEGKNLKQTLTEIGRILLRESKKLVPVDRGYLKKSGFIEVK